MAVHLDTHVVAWLYADERRRLPPAARETLQAEDLVISPAVVLELQYLHEIGRVDPDAVAVVEDLRVRVGLREASTPFAQVVRAALPITWTRDAFDRLIVATASAERVRLLTADRRIRASFDLAIWD